MGIGVVTNESTLFLSEEVTEGTYVDPSAATDAVEMRSEGAELNKTREELSRDTLSGTVEQEKSRVGIAQVEGSIPLEYKASKTAGDAPQSLDKLLKSLLGGKRTAAVNVSSSGHTSTVINFAIAHGFKKGDIVLVKEPNAYECRPIASVTATSITLAFALENGAPSDSVTVEAVTTYYSDTANAVVLSAEHNVGSEAIKQKARGLRAVTGAISNWLVGQLPNFDFTVQGLDLDRVDEDASFTTDFTADATPPVILSACLWLGGEKLPYTELTLNVENTVNYLQSACDADGRIGSRITNQAVTASFNPYLDDTDTSKTWDKFNANDDVSLFGFAYNPTATDGQFGEIIAFWLPQGSITSSPLEDNDGIVAERINFKAHRDLGNDSIFLSFI